MIVAALLLAATPLPPAACIPSDRGYHDAAAAAAEAEACSKADPCENYSKDGADRAAARAEYEACRAAIRVEPGLPEPQRTRNFDLHTKKGRAIQAEPERNR